MLQLELGISSTGGNRKRKLFTGIQSSSTSAAVPKQCARIVRTKMRPNFQKYRPKWSPTCFKVKIPLLCFRDLSIQYYDPYVVCNTSNNLHLPKMVRHINIMEHITQLNVSWKYLRCGHNHVIFSVKFFYFTILLILNILLLYNIAKTWVKFLG